MPVVNASDAAMEFTANVSEYINRPKTKRGYVAPALSIVRYLAVGMNCTVTNDLLMYA